MAIYIFLNQSYKLSYIQKGGLLCQLKSMISLYQKKNSKKNTKSSTSLAGKKDGEILGWSYECILPKLRYEKISVKVKSETPVITPEELTQQGLAMVTFTNLVIAPWGRSNGQFVSYGLSATADATTLLPKKQGPTTQN